MSVMHKIPPETMRRELVTYMYLHLLETLDRNIKIEFTESPGNNTVIFSFFDEKLELKLNDFDLGTNLDYFSREKLEPLMKEYFKRWRPSFGGQ